jgi:hypothetical protein
MILVVNLSRKKVKQVNFPGSIKTSNELDTRLTKEISVRYFNPQKPFSDQRITNFMGKEIKLYFSLKSSTIYLFSSCFLQHGSPKTVVLNR